MTRNIYCAFALQPLLCLSLASCGSDSGGDRVEGIEPGPPPSGGDPIDPPPPPVTDGVISVADISEDDDVNVDITGIVLNSPLTITFNVIVNESVTVNDFTASNARFTLAKLVKNVGSAKGDSWSSFIEQTEDPICRTQEDMDDSNNQCTSFTEETDPNLIDDSARKVQDEFAVGKVVTTQATSENSGTFSDNENGTWSYTYSTDIADTNAVEVHRACIQFSLNATVPNACIDFVPATIVASGDGITGSSLEEDFYQSHNARQIVTEESCNSCHAELTLHGSRTQTDYCVTCHNPGSTDANSGHMVDFKQLVHKIHFAKDLPSLKTDGIPYKIWGFRNGEHDYSKTSYPQNVMTCSRCHAGDEDIEFSQVQGVPTPESILTNDGHNWVDSPTKMACESCHEKLFTDNLKLNDTTPSTNHTDFTDEKDCAGCHRDRGSEEPGGVQANQAHREFHDEQGRAMSIVISAIENTSVGEFPKVIFAIVDEVGNKLDLNNPAEMCADAKYDVRMSSDAAKDYRVRSWTVGGNMSSLTVEGDNDFSVTMSKTVGQGDDAHHNTSNDTIAAMIDFSYLSDCADSGSAKVRIDASIGYEASEADFATPRRAIIDVGLCNDCHGRFLLSNQKHSGLRGANNPEACMGCHTTEYAGGNGSRDIGLLVHSIHASDFRETPYGGYTAEKLQYPGDISNCESCHVDKAYTLPLSLIREPLKTTSSAYSSALGSVCSSCHDSALAKSHMTSAGGAIFDVDFDTANAVVETCDVCHATGKSADVEVVHKR